MTPDLKASEHHHHHAAPGGCVTSQAASAGSSDPQPEQSVLDAIPCLILVIDPESEVVLQVNAALLGCHRTVEVEAAGNGLGGAL